MKSNGLGILGWCAGIAILVAVGLGGEAAARTAPAKYLVCKKDIDCIFVPSICGRCAPCKPTLRPVGNRKKLQWVRMLQTRVRCSKPRCRKCAKHKNWLGTRAVCVRGRCAVAPLRKKPKPLDADLLCKKDKDCVFRPSVCGGCAPCKPTLRQVCNRKTARRIRHMAARARCLPRRCGKCSSPLNWRGSKAVCFQKQCAIAPLRSTKAPFMGSLKCKSHKDCGFWPGPQCGCRPCGLFWRPVANRRSIRREKRRRSLMGACGLFNCNKCARRGLGKRARCIRRRCIVR